MKRGVTDLFPEETKLVTCPRFQNMPDPGSLTPDPGLGGSCGLGLMYGPVTISL